MATEHEVLEVLGILTAAYPRYKPSAQTISVYCKLLADLPGDILHLAAIECATSRTFFPSVYEIRAAAVQLDRRSNAVPSAAEAWQEVLEAPITGKLKSIDYENSTPGVSWVILEEEYKFSHPLVEKVARNLGWPDKFFTDLMASDRARFLQAYETQIDTASSEALSLPEVREYTRGQMEAGAAIRQLTKGWTK